jgi:hypothetical protein
VSINTLLRLILAIKVHPGDKNGTMKMQNPLDVSG